MQPYFEKHIANDSFIALLALNDSQVIATAFLCINEWPAGLAFRTEKTGTLLNVFTQPAFQRKGVATKMLQALLNDAKKQNVSRIDLC